MAGLSAQGCPTISMSLAVPLENSMESGMSDRTMAGSAEQITPSLEGRGPSIWSEWLGRGMAFGGPVRGMIPALDCWGPGCLSLMDLLMELEVLV